MDRLEVLEKMHSNALASGREELAKKFKQEIIIIRNRCERKDNIKKFGCPYPNRNNLRKWLDD